jgi:hypothetical protein
MTDHIPNDLSHLSDAEFHSLCPQGEHAPGPEPLSPTKKTVTLSTLIDGKWIENEYQLNDQDWRDALKLMQGTGISVRLAYK